MPDVQEKLYEPEDDEATHEDGARGNPRVSNIQWMRKKVPNQVDTAGTSKNKLRRGEELEG